VGEDETLIRLDLCEMLQHAGLEVCAEARDGSEAVELARSAEPDRAMEEDRCVESPVPAWREDRPSAAAW
jgi:chemotaxis response regulator CheB